MFFHQFPWGDAAPICSGECFWIPYYLHLNMHIIQTLTQPRLGETGGMDGREGVN